MCSDNDDEKSKTKSWYAADNSLYMSNSDILRVSWSAATSIYQDSIVLCVSLTDCVLWNRCDKDT